ncbi:MAG: formylglycine-generating enzyme family protein [Desulfovibrionaceae bacterium]|nr:formylglycine-generating enzyme family protein [Desulfovibrionaceae bacterium]
MGPGPDDGPEDQAKPIREWRDPLTGMEFVWVPGGCFLMGCGPWTSECHDDESPVHQVCLDGFWMGKYEVTQGQWQRVTGDNPASFHSGPRYPIESVSWVDAQRFIDKLNALSKHPHGFRLPTEAEWEYAARSGGKQENYSGGNDPDLVAWYGDSAGATHPVGLKAPNGLGIYDMSGNVWEWTGDAYDKLAYRSAHRYNPTTGEAGVHQVCRGGSWNYVRRFIRCTERSRASKDFNYNDLGFRLARSADDEDRDQPASSP